jgi:hypothetical protein
MKDINSNNKLRRTEKRKLFLESKNKEDWTLNEIDKLNKEIAKQKRIIEKRNQYLGFNQKENTKWKNKQQSIG